MKFSKAKDEFLEYLEIEQGRSLKTIHNYNHYLTRIEDYAGDINVKDFALLLAKYSHRLRGFTCYPDGARGGQPLTTVDYYDVVNKVGQKFTEEYNAICDITGGGHCGV